MVLFDEFCKWAAAKKLCLSRTGLTQRLALPHLRPIWIASAQLAEASRRMRCGGETGSNHNRFGFGKFSR